MKFESWLTGEQKRGKETGETRKERVSLMSWQTRGATANPVGGLKLLLRWQTRGVTANPEDSENIVKSLFPYSPPVVSIVWLLSCSIFSSCTAAFSPRLPINLDVLSRQRPFLEPSSLPLASVGQTNHRTHQTDRRAHSAPLGEVRDDEISKVCHCIVHIFF